MAYKGGSREQARNEIAIVGDQTWVSDDAYPF
jgi:hypothetical protein